jgi:hypothetical protein
VSLQAVAFYCSCEAIFGKSCTWKLNLFNECCRYQTGALTPLVQWLSQSMQRAAAPPRPPRPAVRAENAAIRQNEDVALAGIVLPNAY